MKATPLLVAWHGSEEHSPIYSAHFEPNGNGRLATAGGDHNVRLWHIEAKGEERTVRYLSTLKKHAGAVNVVRWSPRGEMLASAGDDGNVLIWVPTDHAAPYASLDNDGVDDVEHWKVKQMCRDTNGSEIYDLAWSPDGNFLIIGSMDNVARIINVSTAKTVGQIAEHNHHVQGVAWDPLNEYVATQSCDRSVHVYALKNKCETSLHNKMARMDLPLRRPSSNSPAPPDFSNRRTSHMGEAVGSPRMSAPGTPQSLALPMNPPPTSHSRRSSVGSQAAPSIARSASPSPSLPLPAVMPSASPILGAVPTRNAKIYANESLISFFRRLTFSPDGSLLFTPAGEYRTAHVSADGTKTGDDMVHTVYIYTRAGLNKPPVAFLPGYKKPSVVVKCSPIYYTLRGQSVDTREITLDTRAAEDITALPEPAKPVRPAPTSHPSMHPPGASSNGTSYESVPPGPTPAFGLPYRIVYAVATQDSVHIYDTQQSHPICIVSNLHYATFTDLTWSSDGQTLLITSSDGYCSVLAFAPGELGTVRAPPAPSRQPAGPTPARPHATSVSAHEGHISGRPASHSNASMPSPSISFARPASPARSISASSAVTEASARPDPSTITFSPLPVATMVPSIPLSTPPQTPGYGIAQKRPSEGPEAASQGEKKRRIAPTNIDGGV
ncbi:WD40 repeat-like protein [Piedraia hortae CBS 480.64]|uniref:WD40 repeat-like protein n=1 Tax=Piedraia hortae CBS 480.64 TaxID=1314780 RepID=A0A6A7C7C3_9PEZI|nr:WD40 repeat-like protein [Piedraia hortae CBS 480.64]